jgi:hypothetical protein
MGGAAAGTPASSNGSLVPSSRGPLVLGPRPTARKTRHPRRFEMSVMAMVTALDVLGEALAAILMGLALIYVCVKGIRSVSRWILSMRADHEAGSRAVVQLGH